MYAPECYCREFSRDEINEMPLCAYEGEVRLVRTEAELDAAVAVLRQETVLGFDTETRPNFRKGHTHFPALVQLATAEIVFLVQLVHVPMNAALAAILADPGIIKAGVSIGDDMRELQKRCPFAPAGLVDLGNVARSLHIKTQGLRNLTANFFGCRISKGPRCSNWELPELAPRQISYAATDAWAGRRLYCRMRSLGLIPAD